MVNPNPLLNTLIRKPRLKIRLTTVLLVACCVHTLDLVVKDWAEISFVKTLIDDVRFVVRFVTI